MLGGGRVVTVAEGVGMQPQAQEALTAGATSSQKKPGADSPRSLQEEPALPRF